MKHVVSFSGGRTSAYLVHLMEQKRINEGLDVAYIFMDTGAEHPETYKFVKNIVERWNIPLICLRAVVHHGIRKRCSYEQVSIDDCGYDLKPFAEVIKKYGVPKNHLPHCTLHLKTEPFWDYCKEHYGKEYVTWLGIRADEPRRLKDKEGFRYLAEISDFDKDDVLEWWANQDFDLGFDINSGWLGNCIFCHKKSNPKLAVAAIDEPEKLEQWKNMIASDSAKQLGSTPKEQMYRSYRTIDDIIAMYPNDRDEIIGRLKHSRRFDTGSCSESCEVFNTED